MEAFSDGVIAIIITIMVLSLRQPHGATWSDLRSVLPSLSAYVLSFVNVAIYWINHHHLLKAISNVTGGILWANVNLLFWLSLFPFTTTWMSENGFAEITVAVYGTVFACAAISYYILQTLIVRSQGRDGGLRRALGRDAKGRLSLVSYLISIPMAFVWRWGAILIMVSISIVWFIPDRRLEFYIRTIAPKERSSQ